jgi:predicted O-linked N-acetylglucosamine transferase (SPINDLY family)
MAPAPARKPSRIDLHFQRGVAAHRSGRLDEAVAAYRVALELAPDDTGTLNNLSIALRQQGRADECFAVLHRLVELDPDNAGALNNFAIQLLARGDAAGAASACERALAVSPDLVQAQNNLGNARAALGDRAGAEAAFRAAIARDADFADAHANLGNLLRLQGRLDEALSFNRRAAELAPNRKEMLEGLGQTLGVMDDHDGAVAAFERALAIDPRYVEAEARLLATRQQACAWDGFEERRAALMTHARARIAAGRDCGIEPHFAITLGDDPDFQREVAQSRARRILRETASLPRLEPRVADSTRLRIGYASSHFTDAPTGHLVAGLLEAHDRSKVEVFGYALGRDDGSAYRRRIEAGCDSFVDLHSLPTLEAARRICHDSLHVLVDLRGYAQGQRAAVLALRPAPVQAQLVGFPGTMGAPFIDYLFADATVAAVPGDFTEALAMLPGSYLATDDKQAIAESPARAACALPEGAFVYCSFNTNYKIEPTIFATWMEILHEVRDAVLWLIKSNDSAERNLRRAAQDAGVDPERLVFAPRMPKAQHLARHVHADLFLDTHFVNAHTTAVDALWAGVPVLTWPGRSFVARVGAGLVEAIGLEELVAADRESYRAMAVALGRDRAAVAALKRRLAENRRRPGLLFDTRAYAGRLEAAYAIMWQRHRSGEKPETCAATG